MNNINFYEKYKHNILQRIIFGIFMGFSDSVPGYSGGTTLNLLDFYEIFILRVKLIFKKNTFQNWFKNILWLLPFVIFWIGSILGFSFLSELMAENNLDLALIFLFFSFSLFCTPLFFLEQHRQTKIFIKKDVKNNSLNGLYILIGFLIFLGVALGVYFSGGISLKKEVTDTTVVDKSKWLPLFFVAVLASFVMLIPGISGQLIFYLTGFYKDFSWTILQHPFDNIIALLIVGIGAIIGFLGSVFLINYCLKKIRKQFISLCFGLVIGSPFAIILGMTGNTVYIDELNTISNNTGLIVGIVISVFLGIFINLLLFIYIQYTHFFKTKINQNFDENLFIFLNKKGFNKKEFINKFFLIKFAKKNHIKIYYLDELKNNDIDYQKYKNIYCCLKNENDLSIIKSITIDNQEMVNIKKIIFK